MKKHRTIYNKMDIKSVILLFSILISIPAIAQTFDSNGTYTVPAGVNSITVHAWGGGGGGGSRTTNGGGGGGGSGAYSYSEIAVTPGQTFTVTVGSGGSPGNNGSDTRVSISGTTYVLAKGGNGVSNNTTTGGTGGLAAQGIGDIRTNGGNGSNAGSGTFGNGGNGGNAPNGGSGGSGASNSNASSGNVPGGGGGGGRRSSGFGGTTTRNAGSGGGGRVVFEVPLSYWGSGSRDLYPENAQGGRAYLRASNETSVAIPFPTLGTHYVYAEAGERIALATSAQAYGTNNSTRNSNRNNIRLYDTNGNQITLTTGNNADTNGRIDNRSQELAGPLLPGENDNSKYTPLYHTVTTSGIYRVEFLSTSRSTTGDSRMSYAAANSNWTQDGNSNYLAAWDISVAKQNGGQWEWAKGRTFTTVLNMDNPSYGGSSGSDNDNFRPNSGFYGNIKALTRDGFVYNINNNGNQGIVFTFMVNNRGFHTGNPNVPSYQSLSNATTSRVQNYYHDPRIADSEATVTQKIFYSLPGSDMPEDAIGAVPGGSTWLRRVEKSLDVDNITIEGVEGVEGQLGSKGAYIKFENESGGDYFINIRPKPGASVLFPERELTGPSDIGQNNILWDGKDGNLNPLPVGLAEVEIEIKLRGAEVHFPYIDMELNHNGIIIELLSEDLSSVRTDAVFWDDSNIRTVNTGTYGSMTSPRNASHFVNPNGISSNSNGHIWGTGSTRTVGTFGDDQGMDTWTFIEGNAVTIHFDVDVKEADLYTHIDYAINNIPNASSGNVGETIVYQVTAGNYGPSDVENAPFTFTVPMGIDITNPNNISFTTSCSNGQVVESVPLSFNPNTRTFSSELNLPDGCTITYSVEGTLTGTFGLKTAESTILRPADVEDPDATNGDITVPPTDPHFECYNDASNGGAINCNNIQEVTFMLLQDCTEEYLYYEDFGKGFWEIDSGRKTFVNEASISLNPSTGLPVYSSNNLVRNGAIGGATGNYLFAPGQNDPAYPAAAAIEPNVHRILNGYYAVTPPGYVQMGIPESDPWHNQVWYPGHPADYYDWTPAWDHPSAIRDMSGAVNGAAFLVRGSASISQSIKPFYEFDVPGTIDAGQTYTLSLNSFVTYHDKDYLIMDVVDKQSGQIYVSVPLKYPGPGTTPPGSTPEGVSFGWVPLVASFTFDNNECDDVIEGKQVKIAIRGSQDRSLDTGKGFGHTLIDDIGFTKRSTSGSCNVPSTPIDCIDECYEDIDGLGYEWRYEEGERPNGSILTETFTQPISAGGFILDIYKLDNSFNMNINGIDIFDEEIEFQSGNHSGYNLVQNIRFQSDGARWGTGGVDNIWVINQGHTIDLVDRFNNPTPAIRVIIDRWGNIQIQGKRTTSSPLEPLELFDTANPSIVKPLNHIHWISDSSSPTPNEIEVNQRVIGATAMSVFGYGQEVKSCETCIIEKDGVFTDEDGDGYAQIGETITYTFDIKNLGDMEIYDIEIVDPLFGFTIKLDENTHQPTRPDVLLSGDNNGNGVLDRNETWTFTVKYQVTREDIYTNKGVYNRAKVMGIGQLSNSTVQVEEDSTDPTPYTDQNEGWDPGRPNHTYVPLKGKGLLITNPMIRQKVKRF